MSYNIRVGTAQDGPDRWELRKARVVHLLKTHRPQLLGLQEALNFQLEDLGQAFPYYRILGAGRVDGKAAGEYSAIMYDSRRLEHLKSDTFWLSETPNIPDSKHWGNSLARICTWANFRDLQTSSTFYLFNTHLDHISQPSRVEGMQLILSRIQECHPKTPVLLTGDFNVDESNPVSKIVRSTGFRDTFRVLHPEAKEVGTMNFFMENRGPAKIDFVYADSSWNVLSAAILIDKVDNRWPSDHLPVTAVVEVKQ